MLTLVACGAGDTGQDRLQVAVTTSVWADVVSEIVGDDADVEVLIPRGADSHDYQPTPQQVAILSNADLVVANGLGLEEGLDDVIDAAESDGANVLELAPQLDPIPFAQDGHDTEEEHDDDLDPHVWFDPTRVADAAFLIAAELASVDPSIDWAARAEEYSDRLETANHEIETTLATVDGGARLLVTNHDSLAYWADSYDFDVIGVVIPGGSTMGDPSSAELAALVETIRTENVPAIFTETTQPSALAEAVAAEVGRDVEVVELYTESLAPVDEPAGTLIGMLLENARRISDALS